MEVGKINKSNNAKMLFDLERYHSIAYYVLNDPNATQDEIAAEFLRAEDWRQFIINHLVNSVMSDSMRQRFIRILLRFETVTG